MNENQKRTDEIMTEFLAKENIGTRRGFQWSWDSFQFTPQGDFVSVKGTVTTPAQGDTPKKVEEVFWNFQGICMTGNAAHDLVENRSKLEVMKSKETEAGKE